MVSQQERDSHLKHFPELWSSGPRQFYGFAHHNFQQKSAHKSKYVHSHQKKERNSFTYVEWKRKYQILRPYAVKAQSDYEPHHGGGLLNNSDHFGLFHIMHGTGALLHSTPMRMDPPRPRLIPRPAARNASCMLREQTIRNPLHKARYQCLVARLNVNHFRELPSLLITLNDACYFHLVFAPYVEY